MQILKDYQENKRKNKKKYLEVLEIWANYIIKKGGKNENNQLVHNHAR